jgi:hypothetical protein
MSWRAAAAIAAGLAALALAACGGGGGDTASGPKASAATLARANAICRDFVRETRELGKGALANPPSSTLELTTERLVRPSIPLLENAAARMQALEPAAHDPLFSLYADLFDPAIVLAEKRLAAGRAGDLAESKQLEDALGNLAEEQRRAARLVGLRNCDVDFQGVLLAALTE